MLVLFETLIQKYQQNFIMHYSHNISFLKKCIIYNHKKKQKITNFEKGKKILENKNFNKKISQKSAKHVLFTITKKLSSRKF